ncbi:peptidase [Aureococcus anophagefferens]|nr:peptidase [Aureococcus anophagefferens]
MRCFARAAQAQRHSLLRCLATAADEPTRPRLLLRRGAERGPSAAVKALGGAGGLAALAGVGVLGHAHYADVAAALCALAANPDVVGGALLGAGALAGCARGRGVQGPGRRAPRPRTGKKPRPSPLAALGGRGADDDDGSAGFEFHLLNDDAKLRKARRARPRTPRPWRNGRRSSATLAATAATPRTPPRRCGRCFVYDFDTTEKQLGSRGAVARLEAVVDLLSAVATRHDELVLRVTSPGGSVSDFGLAASLVLRLRRTTGVGVTAAVDVVAASGGYMLAVCSDRVVAAPFAFVGSVGVITMIPNFHRVLDREKIDFLQFTAGRYKRTDLVATNRADSDIEDVATGEAWIASLAPPGVVDDLMTSGELLREKMATQDVVLVKPARERPRSLLEALNAAVLGGLGLAAPASPHERVHAAAAP